MTDSTTVQSLLSAFRALAPWKKATDFSQASWRRYMAAARLVQNCAPADVEQALAQFLDESDGWIGIENETRLFLLMRVIFELPERAPVVERRIFKGWINWPMPDAEGNVNLSWPVDWQHDRPSLLASFEGSDGPRYAAVEEYRYLLAHFPFGDIPKRKASKRTAKERNKKM